MVLASSLLIRKEQPLLMLLLFNFPFFLYQNLTLRTFRMALSRGQPPALRTRGALVPPWTYASSAGEVAFGTGAAVRVVSAQMEK